VTAETAMERFEKVGGIPRIVFAGSDQYNKYIEKLDFEISSVKFSQLNKAKVEDLMQASDKLVKIVPGTNYESHDIDFHNMEIRDQVLAHLFKKHSTALLTMIQGVPRLLLSISNVFEHFIWIFLTSPSPTKMKVWVSQHASPIQPSKR
jgi:hypothetical protein